MSPVLAPERTTERELRAERTAALISDAHTTSDPQERRRLLDEVIELNMPVADAVVSRYTGRGVPTEDLRQVAYVALTRAAHSFDPTREVGFTAFAVPSMRGEVRKYFRDHAWAIRPTRRIQELQPLVKGASDELWRELGRAPRPSEVAERIDAPLADVTEALCTDGCFQPASLDVPARHDGSNGTVGELLGSEDVGQAQAEARMLLGPVLAGLSDRDRQILDMRFMQGLTQREIAEEIGVTQMQVSRLLTRIMRELRSGIGELDPLQRGGSR
jgi:RNA polymerase sigma-B factor